eukprot:8193912-Heterocapsa_arctica.AAC.1
MTYYADGLAMLEYLCVLYWKGEFERGSCREDPDLKFLIKSPCLGDCMRMMRMMRMRILN